MTQPFVRVLGSADWHPTKGNSHSHYTLNDEILIDAAADVVMNLLNSDVDPCSLRTVCFTHLHADHSMGLAPLIHYWRVRFGSLENLTLVGPAATLRAAYERAVVYAFHDTTDPWKEIGAAPRLVEIEGSGSAVFGGWRMDAIDADHAVPGLCYRFTHEETGRTVGFTGDTRYQEVFGEFFREADLLLHECSFGGSLNPEFNRFCRHSSATEAVQVCREAGVKRLLLTHTHEPKRAEALRVAEAGLQIPVGWAVPGEVFPF